MSKNDCEIISGLANMHSCSIGREIYLQQQQQHFFISPHNIQEKKKKKNFITVV